MKNIKGRINTRIDVTLLEKVEREAKDRNVFPNAIIESALQMYFDPNKQDERDAMLARSLAGMNRRLGTMAQDQRIFGEAFTIFIKTWLQHNAELPDEQKRSIAPQVNKRYTTLLEIVARNLAEGKSLYDVLPETQNVKQEDFAGVADKGDETHAG